jgi:hypothetical protein
MKQISLSGMFTVPRKNFDLSIPFLNLLADSVESKILSHSILAKIKAEELEIYICTDGESPESQAEKISKTDRGKYLTYHFWISYPKVVRKVDESLRVDMDLAAFTHEFFLCLHEALRPYALPENLLEQTEKEILEELKNNSLYEFVLAPEDSRLRKDIRQVLYDFEAKRAIKTANS